MVTNEKTGNPLPPSKELGCYHYKPFVSHEQVFMIVSTLHRLKECDFYWSTMSGKQASSLLSPHLPGTFLVRESQDSQHLFTLSIKTETGTKNLRIKCDEESFYLPSDKADMDKIPHFRCVLDLLNHYVNQSKANSAYYIRAGGERVPLELIKPLYITMSSLQHLCRKTINSKVDISAQKNNLPRRVVEFLDSYGADF